MGNRLTVYLAARLKELQDYKAELEAEGIEVTSRWLLGGHEWEGTDDEQIPPERAAEFALEDIEDINHSDVIICFTEAPGSGPARGGRHFEAGYAYAHGKPLVIVGYRENIFYCLPSFTYAETWDEAFQLLTGAH